MIDFIILTIILLFLESYHDYRMAVNYEAIYKYYPNAKKYFKFSVLGWSKDHEQKTKLIKAAIILLVLLFAGWKFQEWIYLPTYVLLRFSLFDVAYYSFEKGRVFFTRKGDWQEFWERNVITYWLKKLRIIK